MNNSDKVCITCNEQKDLNDFYRRKRYKDGHSNTCKKCEYNQKKDRLESRKRAEETACVSTSTYFAQCRGALAQLEKSGDYDELVRTCEEMTRYANEMRIEKNLPSTQVLVFKKETIKFKKNEERVRQIKEAILETLVEHFDHINSTLDDLDNIYLLIRRDKVKILIDFDNTPISDDIKSDIITRASGHSKIVARTNFASAMKDINSSKIYGTTYFMLETIPDDPTSCVNVKIGFSTNIKSRYSTLQTGLPNELILYATIESKYYKQIESHLHKVLSNRKVRGEWFRLSPEEIDFIVNYVNHDLTLTPTIDEQLLKPISDLEPEDLQSVRNELEELTQKLKSLSVENRAKVISTLFE